MPPRRGGDHQREGREEGCEQDEDARDNRVNRCGTVSQQPRAALIFRPAVELICRMATRSIVRKAPFVCGIDDRETCAHNPPVVRILRVLQRAGCAPPDRSHDGRGLYFRTCMRTLCAMPTDGCTPSSTSTGRFIICRPRMAQASMTKRARPTSNQSSLAASPFTHAAPAVVGVTTAIGDTNGRRVMPALDPHARPHGPPRGPASLRSPPRTA